MSRCSTPHRHLTPQPSAITTNVFPLTSGALLTARRNRARATFGSIFSSRAIELHWACRDAIRQPIAPQRDFSAANSAFDIDQSLTTQIVIMCKSLIWLARPTGIEPVFPP